MYPRLVEAESLIEILVGILAVPRASPLVLLHQPPPESPCCVRGDHAVFAEHRSLIEVDHAVLARRQSPAEVTDRRGLADAGLSGEDADARLGGEPGEGLGEPLIVRVALEEALADGPAGER